MIIQKSARKADITVKPCVNNFVSLLIDTASGVTAIDWLDFDANALSLVFNSPLTPSGGTITLDNVVSTFTPFDSGVPLAIQGSVSAVPEPLTLMGAGAAIAFGGAFKRRRSQ